jgi:hypothetical protein
MFYHDYGVGYDEEREDPLRTRLAKRVAGLHLVLLLVVVPALSAEIPCIWTGVEKIVAVGDLHGDYDAFISIISDPEVGIVDRDLRWIAGNTHFVQLGDVMDRGFYAKDIFDLLIRLEKEAAAAGGMVHFLLGNHEELNLMGISLDYPDYVTSQQFHDFLPEDYREEVDREFMASLPEDERKWIESHGLDISPNTKADLFLKNLRTRRDRKGEEAKGSYYRGFQKAYGSWLLQKNIVIRINSVVFAHGGISEKYSKWKLPKINDTYRMEIGILASQRQNRRRLPSSFRPRMVYQPDSPLWFRGLVEADGKVPEKAVYRILDNLEARFMVVGHTMARNGGRSPIVSQESMSRYGSRVWAIDTGISSYYGGAPSAWVYDTGVISVWPTDQVDLPEESAILTDPDSLRSPQETETFLKTAPVAQVKKSEVVGRTDPWTITLDDGKTVRRALFKYIDRRRPDPSRLADSFKYEVAAYVLGKYLGLDTVPPVVEREIEGIPGSLQIFIENAITESERRAKKIEPSDPETFLTAMQSGRVFENLVFNSCEDTDDIYIQEQTWKVFRVDFSEAFPPERKLIPGCDFSRVARELYRRLLGWDDQKVSDLMAPYLNPEETKALNIRRALIVQRIDRLIREKGEESVLRD